MKKYLYILGIALLFTLTSCQDVIEFAVDNIEKNIVIEGQITDTKDCLVRIATTADYYDDGQIPVLSNIDVFLYEDNQVVSQLIEIDTLKGYYTSTYRGVIGKTYFIEASVAAGHPDFEQSTWRSQPETMTRVFDVDSIYTRPLTRFTVPNAFEDGEYVLVEFTEPAGQGDNYRIKYTENDSLWLTDYTLFDDENIDGVSFGDGLFPPLSIFGPLDEPGDVIIVESNSVSDDYYSYLNLLVQQVFQVGSIFDAPPATVIGNIYNKDNTEEFGFGFFSASAVRTDTARFE